MKIFRDSTIPESLYPAALGSVRYILLSNILSQGGNTEKYILKIQQNELLGEKKRKPRCISG